MNISHRNMVQQKSNITSALFARTFYFIGHLDFALYNEERETSVTLSGV